MPSLYANFGAGMVAAKPLVRNAANTAWQECEKYVRSSDNTAWIKIWPPSTLVAVSNTNVLAAGASAGGATARYRLNTSGIVETKSGFGAYATFETWLLSGPASDYQVIANIVSDPSGILNGTFGSQLALSSSREWTGLSNVGNSEASGEFTVALSKISDGVPLATATITLTSELV